ncbi:MAG: hypothetical protein MI864_16070 [Pseudomonadales bacterium]|uniref:Uncharacterized protein n=1 Tax=Oleiphilus messinensis TaxID=141451 RepID=A0A1Y0I289_9GAMM|nr:hypothetical protein [Oleiphilus messinensis]ARU54582.1 hypothetical protein OLMES_0478 [Oleiphilus messinensis]MCG8612043.1 hypothetical protein [Pseudomonadales bacterium]
MALTNYLNITIEKQQPGDKSFLLPRLCLHCGSEQIHREMEFYNQSTTLSSRVMEMILGPFMLLAALFSKNEVVCIGYICASCEQVLANEQKAKKWFWVLWLIGTITLCFGILGLADHFALDMPNLVLWVMICSPLILFVFLWARQQAKLKKIRRNAPPDYSPDRFVHSVKMSQAGMPLTKKRMRFKMVAKVTNRQFIRHFMRVNSVNTEIGYNHRRLARLPTPEN